MLRNLLKQWTRRDICKVTLHLGPSITLFLFQTLLFRKSKKIIENFSVKFFYIKTSNYLSEDCTNNV
jgi:hypothetical protein